MIKIILYFSIICPSFVFAQDVAKAMMLKGEVTFEAQGKSISLEKDQWVAQGSVIKTGKKSFVILLFTDKSKINIGPESEMKIERFSQNDPGIIDVMKGKIRSQVTKDYLQKDKSKLYIKSPSAVMGIRGTDFIFSYNPENNASTTVLLEGQVVFSQLDPGQNITPENYEQVLDKNGVAIAPGEFSVVSNAQEQPTIPAVLNIKQRDILEKTETFTEEENTQTSDKKSANVVPDGLSGKVVASKDESVKELVGSPKGSEGNKNSDGFVADNGQVKPVNGSFVHLGTGLIIPPSKDAVFDANTNSYVDKSSSVLAKGPEGLSLPKNMEISSKGELQIKTQVGNETRVEKVQLDPTKSLKESLVKSEEPAKGDQQGQGGGGLQLKPQAYNPMDPKGQPVSMQVVPPTDASFRDDPTKLLSPVPTEIQSDKTNVDININVQ